ncbi:MAG: membrane-bound lytic murein transglycosylase MltF [Burkholderiales bacterium]|nr:membrane-bound lytic murein transglycosylase MltF [Burkholderiales bacterium]
MAPFFFLFVVACSPSTHETNPDTRVSLIGGVPFSALSVAYSPNPAGWFVNGNGEFSGFEYDLLRAYSEEAHLRLNPVHAADSNELRRKLERDKASVSTGLFYSNFGGTPRNAKILWTTPYFTSDVLLVYNTDQRRPRNWNDVVNSDTVVYIKDAGMDKVVYELSQRYRNVRWRAVSVSSADALFEQVNSGAYSLALVPEHQAILAGNLYLNVATAFPTGKTLKMAWAVPANKPFLRDSLNAFIARAKENGTIDALADRYFYHPQLVNRFDAGVFHERITKDLPAIRALFYDAQNETGIEWRLLAALAYQESQWDPEATSETGVRGLMQITMDTARYLGLNDRLNPQKSVVAGAYYLRQLKNRFPENIAEPDRTWLALASYNIGIGHVEDAQQLALERGLNPWLWTDVRKMLPLLAQPEFNKNTRYGYAKGGTAVIYVARIRAYYDILLHREPDNLEAELLLAGKD